MANLKDFFKKEDEQPGLTPENVAAFRSNLGQKAKDIGASMISAYNKASEFADKSKADMNERSAQLPFAAAGIKPTEAQLAVSREKATERNQIAEDLAGNFGAMAKSKKAATAAEELSKAVDKGFGKTVVVVPKSEVGKVIMSDGKPALTSYAKKTAEAAPAVAQAAAAPVATKSTEQIIAERLIEKGLLKKQ